MLSPDKLSKSSSSLLPSQKSTQNQISHWNKKSVTAFVSMCGCERERERERERLIADGVASDFDLLGR